MKFDGYFATSAREGRGIRELADAIRHAIEWDSLPSVTSSELFQRTQAFLVSEKEAGRMLSTVDDLFRAARDSPNSPVGAGVLRDEFETCILLVESRGLIRRLSFGSLVLLQPELLDGYASALINAARDEPSGLGCLAEEDVRDGRIRVPQEGRLNDRTQEKLLLIATVEDLLHHEIALREYSTEEPKLVFPSQVTREYATGPGTRRTVGRYHV